MTTSPAAPEGGPGRPVLDVADLTVAFRTTRFGRRSSEVFAVSGASMRIGHAETVALVGESGSGKSTIARAVSGLVPYSGTITLSGHDLRSLAGRRRTEAAALRQMVFQDPYSSLDPAMTIGEIIAEPMLRVGGSRAAERRLKVATLLDDVQLPRGLAQRLPAELSGGQRQRVAIARAIAVEPPLVICDEAVSALDVSTRAGILALLKRLRTEHRTAYLFISHDLSVVRDFADRVAVMYFGRLVEQGPTAAVLSRPAHPYTQALIAAAPVPDPRVQRARSTSPLTGELPDPTSVPAGCVFHPRCPMAMDVCREVTPPPVARAGGGVVSCHLPVAAAPDPGPGSPLDARPHPAQSELTEGRLS